MNNEKQEAIIFIGIQGSGKSTFYHQNFPDLVHISLDELRTRHREALLLKECTENRKSFVVDNTNPQIKDRQKYIDIAKKNDYKVTGYYFSSRISECVERNNQREGKARVPSTAVAATYNRLQIPDYSEGFDDLYYVEIKDDQFNVKEWKEDEV